MTASTRPVPTSLTSTPLLGLSTPRSGRRMSALDISGSMPTWTGASSQANPAFAGTGVSDVRHLIVWTGAAWLDVGVIQGPPGITPLINVPPPITLNAGMNATLDDVVDKVDPSGQPVESTWTFGIPQGNSVWARIGQERTPLPVRMSSRRSSGTCTRRRIQACSRLRLLHLHVTPNTIAAQQPTPVASGTTTASSEPTSLWRSVTAPMELWVTSTSTTKRRHSNRLHRAGTGRLDGSR